MKAQLTPIAAALLMGSFAYANDVVPGRNGNSYEGSSIVNLIGDEDYGQVSETFNGGSARDINNQTVRVGTAAGIKVVITGSAGESGTLLSVSGGAAGGGHGGASIIGGISIGRPGGPALSGLLTAHGGDGGRVAGSTLFITGTTLYGAEGGDGGQTPAGAGGPGGQGGGSAFGGISIGGGGGDSKYAGANGGNGGDLTGHTITIEDSTFHGEKGGDGGSRSSLNNEGSGGAAGHGGGSVFGGISMGGGGGRASASLQTSKGGDGGDVTKSTITINNTELIGAAGGDGDIASGPNIRGGGGSGGHGGGSIFGGISSGGAGGHSVDNQQGPTDGGSGDGGEVTGHTLLLQNSTLTGAKGGNGGVITYHGAGGAAGHGGASVFGGISTGGAAGRSVPAKGGSGGLVGGNTLSLVNITLDGHDASGGSGGGGDSSYGASAGAGGHGGGSTFGGISSGGAGGGGNHAAYLAFATGGSGGNVIGNIIEITDSRFTGGIGGNGGSTHAVDPYGKASAGAAGHGGGSIFGGLSTGGTGGDATGYLSSRSAYEKAEAYADGGSAGNVANHRITLIDTVLTGAAGGGGGSMSSTAGNTYHSTSGGGGDGGHGGGSVFGGISAGGAGGNTISSTYTSSMPAASSSNGGNGGAVTGHQITISGSTLNGAAGGQGGILQVAAVSGSGGGSGGIGGFGGGSVIGGISTGGAGGASGATSSNSISSAKGGNGGAVSSNIISITNSTLVGGSAGLGGTSTVGGKGADGLDGGSVFGGISIAGAGGLSTAAPNYSGGKASSNGGNGGDVTQNLISIAGISKISGDIYGGYSQGGAPGIYKTTSTGYTAVYGFGGNANNNTVTLVGDQLTITGAIYGGLSINGNGSIKIDSGFSSTYDNNTLNLQAYQGSTKGVYNFENYNWLLPKGVFNDATLIHITGSDLVKVAQTKHSVAMYNDGNQLNAGDAVVLIDKVQGKAILQTPQVRQGLFLVYDVSLDTIGEELVLSIKGKEDSSPVIPSNPQIDPDPAPDPAPAAPGGKLHPTTQTFLDGRLATLATLNQGVDMVSDYMANSLTEACRTNGFAIVNGGSNRYKTNSNISDSHLRIHDFSLALGATECFALPSQSTVMLGAFLHHGNSSYDSMNSFGVDGDVHGWGNVLYNGGGLMFHMNVAGTGSKEVQQKKSSAISQKNGLYFNASLSAGQAKTHFDSTLIDLEGVRGTYDSKSSYITAMVGSGYSWRLDDRQLIDVYGRYSWTHLGTDRVMFGPDKLEFGRLQSSRVRLGARYNYLSTSQTVSYVGMAYDHEFKGDASGKSYGMSIERPKLQGSTGMVEAGITFNPSAENRAWSFNMGIQGYFGERRGVSGGVKAKFVF